MTDGWRGPSPCPQPRAVLGNSRDGFEPEVLRTSKFVCFGKMIPLSLAIWTTNQDCRGEASCACTSCAFLCWLLLVM